ncbi:MAG: helix-turn-helix domain-containing protein [Ktedonobacterales bacterium]|nr:helix-turn-helix domain-containing protein [Ktedonobacterales bacterium]
MPATETAKGDAPPIRMLLTMRQVAQALSLSLRFANTLVLTGQIRSVKIGRSRRVWVADLQAFVERQAELS